MFVQACATLLLLVTTVWCSRQPAGGRTPQLDIDGDSVYHGLVKENERHVEVSPTIKTKHGAEICHYRVVNKRHGEVPFHVRVVDSKTGEASIESTKELNCEKRKTYRFDIAAVSCDNEISDSVPVRISVVDVNEYEPYFEKSSYTVSVDEGKLYDKILQVRANDDDCSPNYGDICKFEIVTPDQPFVVDVEGNIKNTEPLDWETSRNHILAVVAFDCGSKRSKSTMVNIKVKHVCEPQWKGMEDQAELDYPPGAGRRLLGEHAHLELCEESCDVERLTADISLTTRHIGKGCDRDTYSIKSQRKLCGASSGSVDLLPSPGLGTDWTRSLPTDEGQESDQIFSFDGKMNAVVIPKKTLSHDLTQHFTISTWMKHGPKSTSKKEHIICNADDHEMNRHHWSLFLRNCHLILLMRRPYDADNMNIFRPAEWRWKLSQVCDNDWHHYAVNMNFPAVKLYIDGKEFEVSDKNPQIVDDWPLHPANKINTTTVVGACYHGTDNKMNFYFTGYLAGLSVLRSKTESARVLTCLHSCQESLDLNAELAEMSPGVQTTYNDDMSKITVSATDPSHLDQLVRKVSYQNSRQFPTPGRRQITIDTTVRCKNEAMSMKVSELTMFVLVEQPERPIITITGSENIARNSEDLEYGVKVFGDIGVSVTRESEPLEEVGDEEESMSAYDSKLDSCTILVDPPLDPDHEYFTVPTNLLTQLGMDVQQTKEGIVVSGADRVYNYEDVLRQIHYYNKKPASYVSRTFRMTCSELNGRFMSEPFKTEVSVIHQEPKEMVPAHVGIADKHSVDMQSLESFDRAGAGAPSLILGSSTINEVASTTPNHAVAVIIVVCVGFLVFMIILGIVRIRSAHQKSQEAAEDDKQEMAWDDSSLTITVNPMQRMEDGTGAGGTQTDQLECEESSEEDDDDASIDYDEEDISTDDDDDEGLTPEVATCRKERRRDLEWDDSTLSF